MVSEKKGRFAAKYCVFDVLRPVLLADIRSSTCVGITIAYVGWKIKFCIQHNSLNWQHSSRSECRLAIVAERYQNSNISPQLPLDDPL